MWLFDEEIGSSTQRTTASHRDSSLEVLRVFFKLGVSSFGGPIAHIGYFHEEFVVRRRWLSEQASCWLNQSMQHMRSAGGFGCQSVTWPFVELTTSLRMHRQVGHLREVLPQQSIGVFIGTALPRTLRIAEVNVDVGR